ncbi:MAG: PAS domain S-box protein [Deltaproteobacteria bacterium]|uniref:histidine kinase n=1 Tax=Candidatus Zymogenus saltonus TaxID=2844893 RepID=A0A9D8PP54_9DELT|nr:PAS domain S-box protein [Candidatus Zymogenus saltonus]
MGTEKRLILLSVVTAVLIGIPAFHFSSDPPREARQNHFFKADKPVLLAAEHDAPEIFFPNPKIKTDSVVIVREDQPDDLSKNNDYGSYNRTVRVGIYQNQPKIFIDEDSRPSGIFVDILEEIARLEKWNLVYVPCEWAECLDALENDRIDLMPDVAYSRERDEKYDFHKAPVVDSWSQVYANKSIPMTTLSDLKGRRIALLKRGIQETVFKQMISGFGFNVNIVETKTYEEGFRLAGKGSVDAVISNHLIGNYFFEKYGLIKTPIVFNPVSLYFATAQGRNLELLDAIDYHLNSWQVQPNSQYYITMARWMEKPPKKVVPRYLKWIIFVTLGFLVLSLGVIQILRLQVGAKTRHLVEANELLQKSEEKYRLLVENLNDVIFNLDAEGNITYMNPVAERIFGYRTEDIIGNSFSKYVHPDDIGGLMGSREETIGGVLNPYEFRMVDKKGSIHHVRTSSRPIKKDSQHVGMIGVLTDITKKRKAEEALRESEGKYRTIINTIEDGYFEVDLKGSFTFFNESMMRMLGYDKEKMLGLNYRKYMTKEIADKVYLTFNEVFRTGVPAKNADWRLIRKSKELIDIETSISLKRDDSYGPIGFFGIARDVTEKKKMEFQLLQTEKLSTMGTLMSGVAHELNNPLTSIIGYAQLLSKRDVPDEIKEKLDVILRESIRSSKIVGGLLAFAREHKPERKTININDVLMESIKLREYDLKVSNVDIRTSLSRDLPQTYADPYQLQQVFINLINNARDAIEEQDQGVLSISSYRENDNIVLEFEDTGPGIPEELVNRIFDPFFTTKEAGKGTGLGLSMAYGIIKEHNGTISVESKPGIGTKFIISIPIVKNARPIMDEVKAPIKAPDGVKSILIVEDEASLRDLLYNALTETGYSVEITSTGDEALDILGAKEFDAVISDIKMPGINGKELYLHLQKSHADIADKIIFITGDVLNKETQSFLQNTNNKFIEKPFNVDVLVSMLNEVLSE